MGKLSSPSGSELWGDRKPGYEYQPAFTLDSPRPIDAPIIALGRAKREKLLNVEITPVETEPTDKEAES